MFFAINTKNNALIKATIYTDKNSKYICPICKTEVIIKKGEKNTPHFSHLNILDCEYSKYYKEKKQSNIHKKMINFMYNFFKSYNYVKEIKKEQFIVKNSICDIWVKLKNDVEFVVICQNKKIDENTYKNITYEYNKKGYGVLWVFTERYKNNLFPSCYITNNNEIYALKKIKDDKKIHFDKNNGYEKYFLSSNDAIYLNQRIIKDSKQNVIRIGIGKIENKFKGIYTYDLDKDSIIRVFEN